MNHHLCIFRGQLSEDVLILTEKKKILSKFGKSNEAETDVCRFFK